MNVAGFHLTAIGGGTLLIEPGRAADISDPEAIIEPILACLDATRHRRLCYDLSDVMVIDPVYYRWLNYLGRACATLGLELVCINMQPTAAGTLAQWMDEPPRFRTVLDLGD